MIKEKEVTLLFFFLAKSVIPDYSKKSRERQSENDKLRKTVGSENERGGNPRGNLVSGAFPPEPEEKPRKPDGS